MMKIENDCVGCPQGCIDCGRKRVPHYYCDNPKCRAEETLYHTEDGDFCADCILAKLEKVEGSY